MLRQAQHEANFTSLDIYAATNPFILSLSKEHGGRASLVCPGFKEPAVGLAEVEAYAPPMTDTHEHGLWTHGHRFLGHGHERAEARARLAAGITALFML
ncbi:MAG TPA: hypothetical protein VIY09_04485, partial [Rhizomicrobium sp.]